MQRLTKFGDTVGSRRAIFKLDEESYINVSIGDKELDYEQIKVMKEVATKNYKLNIDNFINSDKIKFNEELNYIVSKYGFVEVQDISDYEKYGCYILVLDEYNSFYIGYSDNIRKRIHNHWVKRKQLERLVFLFPLKSKLSIDSFYIEDTTRIFLAPKKRMKFESDVIKDSKNFSLNRLETESSIYDIPKCKELEFLVGTDYLQSCYERFLNINNYDYCNRRAMDFVDDEYLWPLAYYAPKLTLSELCYGKEGEANRFILFAHRFLGKPTWSILEYIGKYNNWYEWDVISSRLLQIRSS